MIKTFKQITTISLLGFLALNAEARVRPGVYTGVSVGYSNLSPRGYAYEGLNPASQKMNKSASGVEGNLLVGYETPMGSDGVLATEIFGGLNTVETKQSQFVVAGDPDDVRTNKIKLEYMAGLSVNPGIKLNSQATLFLKLGATYGWFKIKNEAVQAAADYTGGTQRVHLWGFTPGARFEWAFDPCWAMIVDANYTFYQSKKSKDFDPSPVANSTYTIKISPRVFSGLVGVTYKF